MSAEHPTELRLVITAEDWPAAVAFFRDALGLAQVADFSSGDGRVLLLEAGRATVEIADSAGAAHIDDVEVGHRVAPALRVALAVPDAVAAAERAEAAGGAVIAWPTQTPWGSLNARLDAPGGVHLTLFQGGD